MRKDWIIFTGTYGGTHKERTQKNNNTYCSESQIILCAEKKKKNVKYAK